MSDLGIARDAAEAITRFWKDRGCAVKASVDRHESPNIGVYYVVVSNLRNGLPPGFKATYAAIRSLRPRRRFA